MTRHPIAYAVRSMEDDVKAIGLIGLPEDKESDEVIIVKDPLLIEDVFYRCIRIIERCERHEGHLSRYVRSESTLIYDKMHVFVPIPDSFYPGA